MDGKERQREGRTIEYNHTETRGRCVSSQYQILDSHDPAGWSRGGTELLTTLGQDEKGGQVAVDGDSTVSRK